MTKQSKTPSDEPPKSGQPPAEAGGPGAEGRPTTTGEPPAGSTPAQTGLPKSLVVRTWILFATFIGVQLLLLNLSTGSKLPIDELTSNRTAGITVLLLKLFGSDASLRQGNQITSNGFDVRIIFECTGLLNMIILTAAVLAFPSSWKAKAIGLIGGNFILAAINQIRILSLIWIGPKVSTEFFEDFHLIFWQSAMIFITLGLWLLWASKFANPRAPAK